MEEAPENSKESSNSAHVNGMNEWIAVYISSGSSSLVQSWTVWPWRWRNHDPSRCHKLTTKWQSNTSQKTSSSATQPSEPQISQHTTYFIAVISKLCTVLLMTQVSKLWSSLQTCVQKVWFLLYAFVALYSVICSMVLQNVHKFLLTAQHHFQDCRCLDTSLLLYK
jgi:hypothetical protein